MNLGDPSSCLGIVDSDFINELQVPVQTYYCVSQVDSKWLIKRVKRDGFHSKITFCDPRYNETQDSDECDNWCIFWVKLV